MKASSVLKFIRRPQDVFLSLGRRGFFNWMSDENYIKIAHWCRMGKKLDLNNPNTYNEKLQWLKLDDRNPSYTNLVDKYEVRNFIKNKIGEEYLIPLLGVWDKVEDVNFDELPEQFVLKCTHDSGGLVICKDKRNLDINMARKTLQKSLKHNYFCSQREWVYKDVVPKIIAEKYMEDEKTEELRDYKFFCFNGEVKALFVATDRGIDTKFDFFDLDFNHIPVMQHYPNANKKIEKPENFEKMLEIAKVLSKGIPHVRVDLYEIDGMVYFGEMTFFHFSGWKKFEPGCYDELFGSWVELPEKR